jgi:hypothetical protein
MNRHDHPVQPGLAVPTDSTTEDNLDELFAEDLSAEEWDASHLPRFSV